MMDYNINTILVPVDFSPSSLNALDSAAAMALRHHAGILLLNVAETTGLSGIHGNGHHTEETLAAMVHHSQQELQILQHSLMERFSLSAEIIVATGMVSSAIIKTVASHRADIIVMGTHGSSGFRKSFIGVNAYNVVKGAACPVLTIPAQKKWDSFRKILFPVRPIPHALMKYDFIRKIIRKNNAVLKILGLATDYERDIDFVKRLATQLNDQLKADEVEATTYFKVGKNMAEEVLKIAALMETDLIVITAAIDTTFKQLFVGPYTQYILNHALFPVLSIKPPGTAGAHASELNQPMW